MRTRKFTIKASLREHRVFRSTGGLGVFLSNFYFISQISESAFRCQWVSLGIAYWWDPHRTLNFSTKKTFAQEWSPTVSYEQDSDGRGLLRLCRLGAGSNHAQANRELNHNLPNKSTLKRFCWQFKEHENTVGALLMYLLATIAARFLWSPKLTVEECINSIFKPFPTCQAYF